MYIRFLAFFLLPQSNQVYKKYSWRLNVVTLSTLFEDIAISLLLQEKGYKIKFFFGRHQIFFFSLFVFLRYQPDSYRVYFRIKTWLYAKENNPQAASIPGGQ